MRAVALGCAAAVIACLLAACGGSSKPPTPGATLQGFLTAWSHGDWKAARADVADPPKDFISVNQGVFTGLGVGSVTIQAAPLPKQKKNAKPPKAVETKITQTYRLANGDSWSMSSTLHMALQHDRWRILWTPATINPNLQSGEKIAVAGQWGTRAQILGAGGAKLTHYADQVVVGLVGQRIKQPAAVRADLIAAGAPDAAVSKALTAAKAHPTFFEPVFTVTKARFHKLEGQPGPKNVYNVPGTQFESSNRIVAVTQQLSDHLVGTIGPITAQQLKQLGPPYAVGSLVGQTGLEASEERTLAGTPTTRVDIYANGAPVYRLATFPGKPGAPVTTSIDPRIQRAAEAALGTATHHDVSMVAIRASTGQVLAAVSDPLSTYNTAFEGAYPPGSTMKVLTSSALFQKGLSPSSPATCPPTITVDGEVFHNAEGDAPVSTLSAAFTESCNTAFIGLATHNLSAADYTAVAKLYGLQRTPHLGVPAFMDNIIAPTGKTGLAADAIGQGNVTFSALGMATVAAAVDSGVVRAPRLVAGAPDDSVPTSTLPASLVGNLRQMMANVVASGTAAGQGLPAGTYAKTGTAEYGTNANDLKIDGWLMGYRGDVAFAIVTHDTGGIDGGPVNGPIIAKFLDAIG